MTKTEFAVFTRSTIMIKRLLENPLVLNGTTFEWKPCVRYLGVELDQRLSFEEHINKVIKKANGVVHSLFCLLKRDNSVSEKTKVMIYKAIIRPVMT